MKRRKFTFTTSYAGAYRRAVKAVRILAGRARHHRSKVASLQQCCRQLSHGSSLLRTGAAACLAIALGMPAMAQQQPSCNVFRNADAANPISAAIPPGNQVYGLDFVDIDGDGDLDCYVKASQYSNYQQNPFPILLRNGGTKEFPVFKRDTASGFQNTGGGNFYSYSDVQFADMDGDGDYDCFIAESYYYGNGLTTIHYFENVGTAQHPVFVSNEAANPLNITFAFYGIGFTIADVDGDGDLDACISPDVNFFAQTVFINTGTPTQPQFDNGTRDYNSAQGHRTYYDWNRDGLTDYFEGATYHRNIGPRANPAYVVDTAGPQFQNGAPYRFADLNNDGFPEVFNFNGGYSTLAPVAVVKARAVQQGAFTAAVLSSATQSPGYTYQWKLNETDIPGATRPTYRTRRPGSYTLAITGSCGTGLSLPYVLQKGASAADDALIAGKAASVSPAVQMQAYPNPFTHSVTLHIAQPQSGGSLIRVCDLQGRVLLTKQTANATVQVGESLSRGMYVVQVWQKGSLVYSGKVMKE